MRQLQVSRLLVLGILLLDCAALGGTSPARPQAEPPKEPRPVPPELWQPFRMLEGTWEAEIEGRLGRGVGRRRYEFIFDDVFVLMRHASVRLPQEKSPEGDFHRELAVYSYDAERGIIVAHEFIVEGYVVQSACKVEPKRFVCVSENVQSGRGIRARLTIEIEDRYRFTETYELAFPGKELSLYFNNKWVRVPALED